MYVLIFFIVTASVLGTRREEGTFNTAAIFALSCLCATLLYSFRFA